MCCMHGRSSINISLGTVDGLSALFVHELRIEELPVEPRLADLARQTVQGRPWWIGLLQSGFATSSRHRNVTPAFLTLVDSAKSLSIFLSF